MKIVTKIFIPLTPLMYINVLFVIVLSDHVNMESEIKRYVSALFLHMYALNSLTVIISKLNFTGLNVNLQPQNMILLDMY